jgi:hypothetical protein
VHRLNPKVEIVRHSWTRIKSSSLLKTALNITLNQVPEIINSKKHNAKATPQIYFKKRPTF